MLIFGHTGITLASAVLLEGAFFKGRTLHSKADAPLEQNSPSVEESLPHNYSRGIESWLTSLAGHIDIRALLIGSLLPDIFDKPIGYLFFRDTFSNGQIFCHTLVFLIIVTFCGICLYWGCNRTWLLALSFGIFTHLILDAMWRTPRTILWPLYGFSFEQYANFTLTRWLQDLWHTLLTHPLISIPELIGMAVIIWFVWLLARRKKLCVFFKTGQM